MSEIYKYIKKEGKKVLTDASIRDGKGRVIDLTYPEKVIDGEDGKAMLFNEADGGGAKFENKDGTWSGMAVHNGGREGLMGQIYGVDAETLVGTRLNITMNGMFYTKGRNDPTFVPGDELVVLFDLEKKVDKIPGMGLSHNDYTNEDRAKLEGIEKSATRNEVTFNGEQVHNFIFFAPTTKGEVGMFLKSDGTNEPKWVAMPSIMNIKGSVENDIQLKEKEATAQVGDVWNILTAGEHGPAGTNVVWVKEESGEYHWDALGGISDLSNYYNKTEVDAKLAVKTNREVKSTRGTALIFNEIDGGGAKFTTTEGLESFVGVNDNQDSEVEPSVQMYVDKPLDGSQQIWDGTIINVFHGLATYFNRVERAKGLPKNDPNHELAIIQDIPIFVTEVEL